MDGIKNWFQANDWWLSSSGWLIGVIGVVLAVVAWVRPYRSKMLAWDVISNTPIAAVPTGAGHELEITYSGRPVKSAHLLVVRLQNTGREAVEVDDYAQLVRFEFSDRSELLTHNVVGESAPLDPTFRVDTQHPRRVELNPLLLNPGDWLDVQFVTDGPGAVPSATTRIANQTRELRRGLPQKANDPSAAMQMAVIMLLGGIAFTSILLLPDAYGLLRLLVPALSFGVGLLIIRLFQARGR